jgi:hypothetical protein
MSGYKMASGVKWECCRLAAKDQQQPTYSQRSAPYARPYRP